MYPDAVSLPPAPGALDCHVHVAAAGRQQFPQLGRASVAEHGTLAAGEHRGHPPAFIAQGAVADRICALVNSVKPTGGDPVRDRAAREARRE